MKNVLEIKKLITKKDSFAKNPQNSWPEFIQLCSEASKVYSFPAKITVCQAALESARGTSAMARVKNNYFGFMAYDADPGKAKKYDTALDSILDYLELITQNPRYSKAMKYKTPLRMIKAIWKAGYATDAQYVEKITSLREWSETYD
jgi:flagellar protein FlgJ